MTTVVWAFLPLPDLNHQTGIVECDEELAAKLIAAGTAQDLRDGATAMKEIRPAPPPLEYETKDMTPKSRPRGK